MILASITVGLPEVRAAANARSNASSVSTVMENTPHSLPGRAPAVTAGSSTRRVKDLNRKAAECQGGLFCSCCYHRCVRWHPSSIVS